ncbi:hypothetical protein [Streptomyces sp. AC555_RSS877]|uniref:hypothetical protein n=1 Tax=Streptomyces sp. AC555_RSS877 TaxID=2823688 RepID=UPI001C26818C|nr:hypothetical protein [Streptomyces sp. AC555_RSS877]
MQESYVAEFALPPDGLSTDTDRILDLTAGRPAPHRPGADARERLPTHDLPVA